MITKAPTHKAHISKFLRTAGRLVCLFLDWVLTRENGTDCERYILDMMYIKEGRRLRRRKLRCKRGMIVWDKEEKRVLAGKSQQLFGKYFS